MGFMDQLKAKLAPAKEKVTDLAQQHGDKIGQGLDKAAHAVDARTKGKYTDKIESGTGKAKEALDRIAHKDDGGTPPPPRAS
ncbi:antitoxin [Streptomyces amakusaensis]|uniref:Antitoxin n=1 Tax=Streptomyces amakusaensis TaxID=67271 RepID=A0ABW0ANU8_9ACTN